MEKGGPVADLNEYQTKVHKQREQSVDKEISDYEVGLYQSEHAQNRANCSIHSIYVPGFGYGILNSNMSPMCQLQNRVSVLVKNDLAL